MQLDEYGEITQHEQRSVEYCQEDLGQGITLDLVKIPKGTFQMGSARDDREKPRHQVTVKSFFLGKYPVTQAQWQAVATLPRINQHIKPTPSRFKGKARPVETASWNDAVEFCQRLSKYTNRTYRLPSESEWEYACRASTTTQFSFGNTITSEIANYNAKYGYGFGPKGQYRAETTNVGSFPANGFGLYDMHGSILEWCQDHWHKNYEGAPTDGSARKNNTDERNRLLRGGGWHLNPATCRSANRISVGHDIGNHYLGFRVACSFW